MEGRGQPHRLHQPGRAGLAQGADSVELIDKSRGRHPGRHPEPAICGFKTDDGEAHTNRRGTATRDPGRDLHPAGRLLRGRPSRPRRCATATAVEYHKTIYTILGKKPRRRRGLIFARSGFHGTQAFPGCWAGDNQPNFGEANGLPSVIVAGLSAALSGFSIWGHDVGGYQNEPYRAHIAPIGPLHALDAVRLLHPDHADAPPAERPTPRTTPTGSIPGVTSAPERGPGRRARLRRQRGPAELPVLRQAAHPVVPLHLHLRQGVQRDRPADHASTGPAPPGRPDDVRHQPHLLLRQRTARRPRDRAEQDERATSTSPRAGGSTSGRTSGSTGATGGETTTGPTPIPIRPSCRCSPARGRSSRCCWRCRRRSAMPTM